MPDVHQPPMTERSARLPRLAQGWPLLAVPVDGRLEWPGAEASVAQAIEVVLRTAPGEQLMRPAFGAGLERYVHAPNTLETRARMEDAITAALGAAEPRIRVETVRVEPTADPRRVAVTIAYRLVLTGVVTTMSATVPVGGA